MKDLMFCLILLVPAATIFETIVFDEPEYILTEAEWNDLNPPEPTEAISYFDLTMTSREPLSDHLAED